MFFSLLVCYFFVSVNRTEVVSAAQSGFISCHVSVIVKKVKVHDRGIYQSQVMTKFMCVIDLKTEDATAEPNFLFFKAEFCAFYFNLTVAQLCSKTATD